MQEHLDLTLTVMTKNIDSLVSIYRDSSEVRDQRESDLLETLKIKSEWTDEQFERYSHYYFHFDWLLIQSLFISSFSYLEIFMKELADQVEKNGISKIKVVDIKGNGYLDSLRKYLHLVAHIKSASSEKREWLKIIEFKSIRNALTHDYGFLKKPNTLTKQFDILRGNKKGIVRINKIDFLEDFSKVAIDYMNSLVSELKESYCENSKN